MAWVYMSGRVTFHDEHGLKGSKELPIRIDDTVYTGQEAQITAALTVIASWTTAFDNVIDAQIDDVTLSVPLDTSTFSLKTSPGEQGVAEGALLLLSTQDETGTHQRPYWLPSASEGVFLADFKTVDTGDTALLAWLATFNDADELEITISDNEEVLSIISGRYATKRRDSSQ